MLSVIIPVYNTEEYLEECIDSVINQSLSEIEIILVDDETPDKAGAICDRYAQKYNNITVIHKKNEGLGFARNSGLEIVKGEYIAFLDSDDKVNYDYYELLVNKCRSVDADICIAKGFYKFFKNDYQEFDYLQDVAVIENKEIMTYIPRLISKKIDADDGIWGSVCFSIYKKDFIKRNKLRFVSERFLVSEDIWFSIDAFSCANRIVLSDISGYCYRYNGLSLSRAYRDSRFEQIKNFVIKLEKKCEEIKLDDYKERIAMYYWVNFEKCVNQEVQFKPRKQALGKLLEMCNDSVCREYMGLLACSKRFHGMHSMLCILLHKRRILLCYELLKVFNTVKRIIKI